MKEQWEWPDIFPESCYANDGSLGECQHLGLAGSTCKTCASLEASRCICAH